MANIPLIEPFILEFEIENKLFRVRVTYTKSGNSCYNVFETDVLEPVGSPSFTLQEKVTKTESGDMMLWVDEKSRHSGLYQLIGEHISDHLKNKVGVVLMDSVQ